MTINKEIKLRAEMAIAFTDYEKMLLQHAFAKTSDQGMSENMVQQTFLKTWIYLVKQGKIDLMKAFLYHVLKNIIIDEYRKPKAISLDFLMEKNFEPRVIETSSLINFIDGKAAMLLINNLPKKYKKIMQMRYIQDLSLIEIQRITGQSKNSVAVQAHRGLAKLKVLYDFVPVK